MPRKLDLGKGAYTTGTKLLQQNGVWSDTVSVDGTVGSFTTQGGGWKDILGYPTARKAVGAGVPTFSAITGAVFYGYKFAVNDSLLFTIHMPHDYKPATAVYLHTHWVKDGTNVQPVKWQFTVAYAPGYARGAFPLASPTVASQTTTPASAAYTHEITETASYALASGEVDGLLLVEAKRITNGGTNNTDGIYLLMMDVHYQANTVCTKNRNYPFYT